MNEAKRLVIGISLAVLPLLTFACATSSREVPVQVQGPVFAQQGDRVQLFYGGSKLAKEDFCPGAVVPVYRYEGRTSTLGSTGTERKEVGKIKVTRELGDYYVEGIVVQGSIKSGDVAVQPRSGCLIQMPGPEYAR